MPRVIDITHCIKGHPYDASNTVYYSGKRYCRECQRYKAFRRSRDRRVASAAGIEIVKKPILTVQERLEANRKITDDGHWLWLGSLDKDGYGQIWVDRTNCKVHRISYRLYTGCDLDNGVLVLHNPSYCTERSCFSPYHLYTGTNKDNSQDMKITGTNYESNRTHCPQGHIYDGGNFRLIVDASGGVHRKCIICDYLDNNKLWKESE